ncbi:hypothetical protein B9Z19DRAFT_275313 [Tuber borchii]|uniref:Uncharacterized protein n=1 Tax=Tuber borchii TaxID=42251 RepID=A0A2T7A915_TUBBO|nr:hypothetical protein B9Z19DRAFT_275313 [Tuber borchii]
MKTCGKSINCHSLSPSFPPDSWLGIVTDKSKTKREIRPTEYQKSGFNVNTVPYPFNACCPSPECRRRTWGQSAVCYACLQTRHPWRNVRHTTEHRNPAVRGFTPFGSVDNSRVFGCVPRLRQSSEKGEAFLLLDCYNMRESVGVQGRNMLYCTRRQHILRVPQYRAQLRLLCTQRSTHPALGGVFFGGVALAYGRRPRGLSPVLGFYSNKKGTSFSIRP